MNKKLIIAGFAGVGKTTLAKKYQNVIDLESSTYKWDNTGLEHIPVEKRKGTKRNVNKDWPNNYINAIKEAIKKYDIVLVWIHLDALKLYDENNLDYILCFPTLESIDVYEERYKTRGNNEEYINKVVGSYNTRYYQLLNMNKEKIILNGNETLEDYLIKHNYNLIKK